MVQSRVLCKKNAAEVSEVFGHSVCLFVGKRIIRKIKEGLEREMRAKVQELDLSYHGISSLAIFTPAFIGMDPLSFNGFCSLRKLDLSHNQLDKLSESIGSLLSLTHLFLNDNYLSSLQPIIIGRLVNLQELDLRNNKLNNFSLDITELSCLRRLSVQGNPLKDDETRKLMKLAHNERWIDIAGESYSKTSSQRPFWVIGRSSVM